MNCLYWEYDDCEIGTGFFVHGPSVWVNTETRDSLTEYLYFGYVPLF